jgi:hypothetical protein
MDPIQSFLQALGLDRWLPLLLALHMLASAIDALLPQPAPGSHWLPLRKLVSVAAGNVANAQNILQPSLVTWLQRVIVALAAVVPPPAPTAPTAAAAPAPTTPPSAV